VSKLKLVIPILRKEAELTKDAVIQALKPFATWVQTILLIMVVSFAGILTSPRHWVVILISPSLIIFKAAGLK
jgi:hypothetical protein